jgi:sugar/nucleoside kinase (ribokinase family)
LNTVSEPIVLSLASINLDLSVRSDGWPEQSQSRVRRRPGQATGGAMIARAAGGDKTILLAANANDSWPEGARDELTHVVRMSAPGSLLVADLEVPPALVVEAARCAREHDLRMSVDPSPAERVPDALAHVLQRKH